MTIRVSRVLTDWSRVIFELEVAVNGGVKVTSLTQEQYDKLYGLMNELCKQADESLKED